MGDIRSKQDVSISDELTPANHMIVDSDGDANVKSKIWDGTDEVDIIDDSGTKRFAVDAKISSNNISDKKGKFILCHLRKSGSPDLNIDGSTTSVEFTNGPGTGKRWFISRMIMTIEDVGMNWQKFGGLPMALTNGLEIEYTDGGTTTDLLDSDKIKSNRDFIEFCYDGRIEAASTDIFKLRWAFSKAGTFLQMNNADSDVFTVRVNDNLVGLNYFHVTIQGYEVDE